MRFLALCLALTGVPASLIANDVLIELEAGAPDRKDFFATGVRGFSGEVVEVPLRIGIPQGGTWKLEAEWLQITGAAAAPLPGRQLVVETLDFSDISSQRITAKVQLPEVKRESKMVVRFLATRTDEAAPAPAVATIAGFAFPDPEGEAGLITALRSAAETLKFGFAGDAPGIRKFFSDWEIPFEEGAASTREGIIFYEGDAHPEGAGSGARWLWFAPPDTFIPGIYPPDGADNKATRITLPILDTLATDPFSQKTLLYLIQPSILTHTP